MKLSKLELAITVAREICFLFGVTALATGASWIFRPTPEPINAIPWLLGVLGLLSLHVICTVFLRSRGVLVFSRGF
jgi:apolipoprotein N-acyltransferase